MHRLTNEERIEAAANRCFQNAGNPDNFIAQYWNDRGDQLASALERADQHKPGSPRWNAILQNQMGLVVEIERT